MEIYAAKIFDICSELKEEYDAIIKCLDKDRQKKIAEIRHEGERLRSIFAGLLFRYIFFDSGFEENEWNQLILEYNEYGKPSIKGFNNFNYSISHSGEWIICVADDKNIGADIQEKRPWKLQMAKRFYSEKEYERLISLGEKNSQGQTDYFYKTWSAKESCVKFTGRGIGGGINQYVTDEEFEHIDELNSDGKILNSYNIRIYEELEGYIISVCSKKNQFPNKITIVESEVLFRETGDGEKIC